MPTNPSVEWEWIDIHATGEASRTLVVRARTDVARLTHLLPTHRTRLELDVDALQIRLPSGGELVLSALSHARVGYEAGASTIRITSQAPMLWDANRRVLSAVLAPTGTEVGNDYPFVASLRMACPIMWAEHGILLLALGVARDVTRCAKARFGGHFGTTDGAAPPVDVGGATWSELLSRRVELPRWRPPPAAIVRLRGVLHRPAEDAWLRTVRFTPGPAHRLIMASRALGVREHGMEAELLWPFGLAAFDAEGRGDVEAEQRPDVAQAHLASWTVLARTCGRPPNDAARPSRMIADVAAAFTRELRHTKGTDPCTLAMQPAEDGDDRWEVRYAARSDERGVWHFDIEDLRVESALAWDVELEGCKDHEGRSLIRRLQVTSPPDGRLTFDPATRRCEVRLQLTDVTPPSVPRQRVRIGALDLVFDAADAVEPELLKVVCELRPLPSVDVPSPEGIRADFVSVSSELRLAISEFVPAAQEPLPGEHRAAGQLILAASEEGAVRGSFVLKSTETVAREQSHALTLGLFSRGARQRKRFDLLVIDTEPFLLARVQGDLDIVSEIGNRSPEGSWELADKGAAGLLLLPPQAVAEDAIKTYADGPLRPTPDVPLPFRFSPPGSLRLRRTVYEAQSFTEAPWNVRRLLGDARSEYPGAPLLEARFELLYGLEHRFADDDAAPRVTDPFVRAGPLPGLEGIRRRAERGEQLGERERRHLAVDQALRARVSMLEPYLIRERGPWEPASGVSAQLRGSRSIADPFAAAGQTPAPPFKRPYAPDAPDWGVRGGFDWGFVSRGALDEVIETPIATAARIRDIRLSALGGSGWVQASFARDKTRVYAESYLGRAFYYCVERIGRIAIFWNVAKHIVVYERSVHASGQFPDSQGVFDGRPVLRKVREVVHVTERDRPFPDRHSSAAATSFVRGARFPEEPIEVDSQWGADVELGWEIPLYRLGTARPAPTVQLELAGARAVGESVWGRILNPQNLYFFTSTRRVDDANTDAWPAFVGTDLPLEDIPTRGLDPAVQPTSEPLPPVPAVVPGLERFTFSLDVGGERVDVTAGRSNAGIGAVPTNITLARRAASDLPRLDSLRDVTELKARIADADAARERSRTLLSDLFNRALPPSDAEIGGVVDALTAGLPAMIARTPDPFELLASEIAKSPLPDLALWAKREGKELLSQGVPSFFQRLGDRGSQLDDPMRRLSRRLVAVEARWSSVRAEIARWAQDAEQALVAGAGAELDRWEAACRSTIAELVGAAGSATAELESLHASALGQLPVLADEALSRLRALAPVARTPEAIRAELSKLEDAFATVESQLAAARVFAEEQARALQGELERVISSSPLRATLERILSDAGEIEHNLEQATQKAMVDCAALEASLRDKVKAHGRRLRETAESSLGPLLRLTRPAPALDAAIKSVANELGKLPGARAKAAIEQLLAQPAALIDAARSAAASQLTVVVRSSDGALREAGEGLRSSGLRLLRAVGEPPKVPGLDLTRQQVAYFFHERAGDAVKLLDVVHMTPSVATLAKVEGALQALQLQFPTNAIGDALKADLEALARGYLRDVFPDFAGIHLTDLLPGLRFPSGQADNVRIRHGADPISRQAWVECTVKLSQAEAKLFDPSPLGVVLKEVRLEAAARVEASAGGMQRTARGTLTAHWHLVVGSQDLLAIRDCKAELEGGRLSFHIDPKKIDMPAAIRFLSDLLAAATPSGANGLTLTLLHEGDAPIGIRASLGLALPTLATGAFSISNLSLNAYLEAAFRSGGFSLATGLGLSSRERPFQLGILFLSGGGWFEIGVVYQRGHVVPRLSIGIAAGASLPFNIGVASGVVSALVDVGVEWTGGSPVHIVLGITLRGEVQVLGLISISIMMRLQADYEAGGALVCSGRLVVRVKICWFIKINVDVGFKLRLAGQPRQAGLAFLELASEDRVDAYLARFGGFL